MKTVDGETVPPETPVPLTKEQIAETIQDFVRGAKLAKDAGFDGVELHAANGYLLDQFLQSVSNDRTDEYGGSFENRMRLLSEIIDAIVASEAFPSNRIGVRISPNGVFGSMGSKDNFDMFTFVARELNKKNIAYLHVMDGLAFGYHELCPPVTASDIRKSFEGPILCNVALTKEIAEGMIRSGACDAAVFGRLFMSNPDLVERFANDWPLADPAPYESWWNSEDGSKGYTDWPTYVEGGSKAPSENAAVDEGSQEETSAQ